MDSLLKQDQINFLPWTENLGRRSDILLPHFLPCFTEIYFFYSNSVVFCVIVFLMNSFLTLKMRKRDTLSGLGICSSVFWANRSFFVSRRSFVMINGSESLMVALLYRAMRANSRRSLKKSDFTDEILISDVNRHKTSLAIIYMCLKMYCYKCTC